MIGIVLLLKFAIAPVAGLEGWGVGSSSLYTFDTSDPQQESLVASFEPSISFLLCVDERPNGELIAVRRRSWIREIYRLDPIHAEASLLAASSLLPGFHCDLAVDNDQIFYSSGGNLFQIEESGAVTQVVLPSDVGSVLGVAFFRGDLILLGRMSSNSPWALWRFEPTSGDAEAWMKLNQPECSCYAVGLDFDASERLWISAIWVVGLGVPEHIPVLVPYESDNPDPWIRVNFWGLAFSRLPASVEIPTLGACGGAILGLLLVALGIRSLRLPGR